MSRKYHKNSISKNGNNYYLQFHIKDWMRNFPPFNHFPKSKKKSYKITLEDGKEIICSEEHLFPTQNGEVNIKGGLKEGMCLYVKE